MTPRTRWGAALGAIALSCCGPGEQAVAPPKTDAPHVLPEHCDQMMNRYIDLLVAAPNGPMQYWSPEHRHEAIRDKVEADPNMQGFRRECIRTATGRQYACAVRAATVAAWLACVR